MTSLIGCVARIVVAFGLMTTTPIFAFETELADAQISALLDELAQKPRPAWLGAGMIEATGYLYQSVDESLREVTQTTWIEGERIQTQIKTNWMDDPDQDRRSFSDAENTLRALNTTRVILWDGKRQCRYFPEAQQAWITEGREAPFPQILGSFQIGIIPWGMGPYGREALEKEVRFVSETVEKNRREVRIRIRKSDSLEQEMILDRQRGLSPISFESIVGGNTAIRQRYREYVEIAGYWIPQYIVFERFDPGKPDKVVSYEQWRLRVGEPALSQPSFILSKGTMVKYEHPFLQNPVWFRMNPAADTESLIREKTELSGKNVLSTNCARTVAGYVCKRMGKTATESELTKAISTQNAVSLMELNDAMAHLGLYARAVRTDLAGLQSMNEGTAILHLSDSNHYVVLDRIEDRQVWIVDLTSRLFYSSVGVEEFLEQWKGVVLWVTSAPVRSETEGILIDESTARSIVGSGYYACSDPIQLFDVVLCPPPLGGPGGVCTGKYRQYDAIWGCQESTEPGTCSGTGIPRGIYAYCINDLYDLDSCTTDEMYIQRSIRGCLR